MKTISLHFVGGFWHGRELHSDSDDPEETFLVSGCYEMSHHGNVGAVAIGLSGDAIAPPLHTPELHFPRNIPLLVLFEDLVLLDLFDLHLASVFPFHS